MAVSNRAKLVSTVQTPMKVILHIPKTGDNESLVVDPLFASYLDTLQVGMLPVQKGTYHGQNVLLGKSFLGINHFPI